jgi:hypothetical protein
MSAPYTVDGSTITVTSNVLGVPNNGITISQLANNSVSTTKILDQNVTNAKIADNSINADKMASNAVSNSIIQDDAITPIKFRSVGRFGQGSSGSFGASTGPITTGILAQSTGIIIKIAFNSLTPLSSTYTGSGTTTLALYRITDGGAATKLLDLTASLGASGTATLLAPIWVDFDTSGTSIQYAVYSSTSNTVTTAGSILIQASWM